MATPGLPTVYNELRSFKTEIGCSKPRVIRINRIWLFLAWRRLSTEISVRII